MIFRNENIDAALYNIEDFQELPSCGVEDVDRAIHDLFANKLPFFYTKNKQQVRVPAIFASGERAVILKKRKALRDESGALILPVISILRTSLTQDPEGYGLSPTDKEIVIKRKIYKDNADYKREKNFENLSNADYTIKERVTNGNFSKREYSLGQANPSISTNKQNIYEYYTIPVPRFFKVEYDITFWCQFQKQLNDMTEALMSYYNTPARAFMLESDKGYKFTSNFASEISLDINADALADSERIIKGTIKVESYGYVINPQFPGSISSVKRYVTQPKVVFETNLGAVPSFIDTTDVESNNPDDYVESDWSHEFEKLPGSGIGLQKIDESREADVTIGTTNKLVSDRYVINVKDPVTGETKTEEYIIKSINKRKGETVLRQVTVL
tara:strand:+ start:1522 stop:2682 length:1161 start_codon:yes stop_codon:yes gene_type:complete